MTRSSAITAKDPITAETRFYQWLAKYPGNKTGDPRTWVKDVRITKDNFGLYYVDYEGVKAKVMAAGLPNATDCNGCVAWDVKKDDCAEGDRPATCDHKPEVKRKPAEVINIEYKKAIGTNSGTNSGTINGDHKSEPTGSSEIEVSRIFITHWNPRTHFDQDKLKELAQDIEKNGLLQPIVVRRKGEKSYELVIGERRLRAFREILKRETIPANIKDLNDEQVVLAMLSENLQREDLNPIEEAQGLKRVLEFGKMSQVELATRIGMSPEWVSHRLKLLDASPELQGLICRRLQNASNAYELVSIKDPAQYEEVMILIRQRIKDNENEQTREQLRKMIDGLAKPEPPVVDTPAEIHTDEPTIVGTKVCTEAEEETATRKAFVALMAHMRPEPEPKASVAGDDMDLLNESEVPGENHDPEEEPELPPQNGEPAAKEVSHGMSKSKDFSKRGHWNCRISEGFCYGWTASEDPNDDVAAMLRHMFIESGASVKAHEAAHHRVARCIREGGNTWGLLQKLFSKEVN